MKVAVVKEVALDERRVALVPDVVARWVKKGVAVSVEAGAGERAGFTDEAYAAAGAEVTGDRAQLWQTADLAIKVSPPTDEEVGWLRSGSMVMGFLEPLDHPQRIQTLADRGITALALEFVPRSTRAQVADALSSQASAAGYKAVLLAAAALPRYFPMLTTAAGTIPPAKVLILGVGVAGLQAIATARRLGAVVEAFDIRPETRDDVQSLGARFVEMAIEEETSGQNGYAKAVSDNLQARIQATVAERAIGADVVITTAKIPGRRAPIMITADTVAQMKTGSVIVDLAAEQGGNCECSQPGHDIAVNGVQILAPMHLAATVTTHASMQYAKNCSALMDWLIKDGEANFNFADDILDAVCITHAGEIRNDRIRKLLATLAESQSSPESMVLAS
ncbi:MAG TPA: Re/Si-specific NAD(P)(+) transhydrogenase subunit alpha [Coleofasciculaceae cyanobacterium]